LHHLFLSLEVSKLIDLVDKVLIWDEAWFMWIAVSALKNWGALLAIVVASSCIGGTGLIGGFIVMHP